MMLRMVSCRSRVREGSSYCSADGEKWAQRIKASNGQVKAMADTKGMEYFTKKNEIFISFTKLLERFQDNIKELTNGPNKPLRLGNEP